MLIKTHAADDDTLTFKMERSAEWGYDAQVIGTIQSDGHGTYLYGKIIVPNQHLAISATYFFCGIGTLFANYQLGLFMILGNILMLLGSTFNMKRKYQTVHEIFGKSKKTLVKA